MKLLLWEILICCLSTLIASVLLHYSKLVFMLFKCVFATNNRNILLQFFESFTNYANAEKVNIRRFIPRILGKEDGRKKHEKKSKDKVIEVCTEVSQPVGKVCNQSATAPTNNDLCFETELKEECEDVAVTIPKICLKTVEEKVAYDCLRKEYQNYCRPSLETISEICTKLDIRKESYLCPTLEYYDSCKEVPVRVVDKCYKTVEKSFPYECETQKIEKECKQIPMEKEDICKKVVALKSPYDCSVTEYVNECSTDFWPSIKSVFSKSNIYSIEQQLMQMHLNNLDSTGNAHFGINNFEALKELNLTNGYMPNDQASNLAQKLRGLGGKKKSKKIMPFIETGIACKNVPILVKKTCYYDESTVESYSCTKQEIKTECHPITVSEQGTCYETLAVQEAYECEKIEMKKDCQKIPVHVDKTCEREIPYEKQFECEVANYKMECEPKAVEVPDTCFKEKPVTESYPCPQTVIEHVCRTVESKVNRSCSKNQKVEVSEKCEKTEIKKQCYYVKEDLNYQGLANMKNLKSASSPFSSESLETLHNSSNVATMNGATEAGTNKIMVMKNQKNIRKSNKKMLEQSGFDTTNNEIVPKGSLPENKLNMILQNMLDGKLMYMIEEPNFGNSKIRNSEAGKLQASIQNNGDFYYLHEKDIPWHNVQNRNFVEFGSKRQSTLPKDKFGENGINLSLSNIRDVSNVVDDTEVPRNDAGVVFHENMKHYVDPEGRHIYIIPYSGELFGIMNNSVGVPVQMYHNDFKFPVVPP